MASTEIIDARSGGDIRTATMHTPCEKATGKPEQSRDWAAEGIAFVVRDTETGAEVTRVLLA